MTTGISRDSRTEGEQATFFYDDLQNVKERVLSRTTGHCKVVGCESPDGGADSLCVYHDDLLKQIEAGSPPRAHRVNGFQPRGGRIH